MTGVLSGFVGLAAVVLTGYVLARTRVVGAGAADTLSRIVFHAGVPMLMVRTVSEADVAAVFSTTALVTILTTTLAAAIYAVLARTVLGMDLAGTVVGALCASYVNAGNLGLPILALVVGTVAPLVPAFLLQLLVMVPVSFVLLGRATGRPVTSRWQVLTPAVSPPVLGVVVGLVLSLTGWQLPEIVARPVGMLADMAIPMLLIAFGLSIHGGGETADRTPAPTVWTAVALKTLGAPAIAWAIGSLLGLTGDLLLGVVVVAALPTAQNIFVYSMRFATHVDLARRAILGSTALCVPVIVVATGLLGGAV